MSTSPEGSLQQHSLTPPRTLAGDDGSRMHSAANSTTGLGKSEQQTRYPYQDHNAVKKRRGPVFWLACVAALIIVILAVILPIYFTVIKKKNNTRSDNSTSTNDNNGGNGEGTGEGGRPVVAITGGDGSTVTTEDGNTFTYSNSFGGFWVSDPSDPYGGGGKPNSWTPALNETWTWGQDRAYGVNLGGWFVLEPFIVPGLFQKYPAAVDEWTLSELMAADTASGGLNQLEEHYQTFITEKDFADIAGAGLNWVRLPVPFWAIDRWEGEPFLEKVCWKYIVRAFDWARKYGLRVNLDLHTIPGSQNGYNHSGKTGEVNFMRGTMGIANAQRALDYIRIFTEFISQREYQDVVQMFGIMNEAIIGSIGRESLTSFYRQAHDMIRGITGTGEGNGFYISLHDGFETDMTQWDGFLAGSDRIVLDRHPYTAFSGSTFDDPIATGTGADAGGVWVGTACGWATESVRLSGSFGVNYAGEWSNGYNDCGLFLTGVNGTQTYGGDCTTDWEDSSNWDESIKAGLLAFNSAQMDAFKDFFFWTWKIGESEAGIVQAPLWSYSLGLEGGWILRDPRQAAGKCGAGTAEFDGNYEPYMTGGTGAGTIVAAAAGTPFPPAQIYMADVPAADLPQYTPTGTVNTLAGPSATGGNTLSGWYDTDDTDLSPTPIAGCDYPNPWDAVSAAIPAGCGAAGGGDAADPPAAAAPVPAAADPAPAAADPAPAAAAPAAVAPAAAAPARRFSRMI